MRSKNREKKDGPVHPTEMHMAGKQEILRELEGMPEDALKDVEDFIYSLKKHRGKRRAVDRNGAKKWDGLLFRCLRKAIA